MKKAVTVIMLILLFAGLTTLILNIQSIKSDFVWTETIYIRADGSVEPATAPISSVDNVTYTLTDNIVGEVGWYQNAIVVRRDNTVVDGAGYSIQGIGWGTGIGLSSRSNVTIKNMKIERFECGIWLTGSSNNSITGNTVKANVNVGILLYSSSKNNNITGNNIIGNTYGIYIDSSSNNVISGNNIRANWYRGIVLHSSNNKFFHNHIYNNADQVWDTGTNVWDNGYPSGGNYWSDYAGTDSNGDSIGDTPYVIDRDNQDRYPIMIPRDQHDIGIAGVNPPRTIVGEGFNVQFDVSVFNYGNTTETFNITAYNKTSTLGAVTNITLTGENSTIAPFAWNTSDFAKGNYFISFYLTPAPNETYTEDNTYTHWVFVTIIGDVDGDRDVDVGDQRKVALLMFKEQGDPYWNPNWDVDQDGDVDVGDQRKQEIHMFQHW